ncbi:hypothetical protein SBADM41S_04657 [Streptomyces badius]
MGALVLLADEPGRLDIEPWPPPTLIAYHFLLLALGVRETRRTDRSAARAATARGRGGTSGERNG